MRDLLSVEAHRAAAGFEPDPARLRAGWDFRFVADARRVEETVQLYRELGFEVTADPVHGRQIADACVTCQLVTALQFQAVYTRKTGDAKSEIPG